MLLCCIIARRSWAFFTHLVVVGAHLARLQAGSTPKPMVTSNAGLETFLLFVGSKQSGKTTLIAQFLNRSKRTAPPLLVFVVLRLCFAALPGDHGCLVWVWVWPWGEASHPPICYVFV